MNFKAEAKKTHRSIDSKSSKLAIFLYYVNLTFHMFTQEKTSSSHKTKQSINNQSIKKYLRDLLTENEM